jgi:DNA-binding beta-propeller fold protein YncE
MMRLQEQKGETRMKRFVGTCVVLGAAIAALVTLGHARRAFAAAPAPGVSGYHVAKTLAVGGEGSWDYVTVDSDARRVYVSHGTHVVVLDADSGAAVGDIPDTQGVHGIALAPALGKGFVSDGRANQVTVFEMKTLKTTGTVPVGTNPDAIVYDGVSKRVFAMNGRSHNATAIDAATDTVAGTLELGGKPEFAVADGKGNIYVNIEDKSELVEIDARKLSVTHRWPLAPCQEPSGLAMDEAHRRLFAGCDNKMMAVVDADSGKVLATPAIGEGVDANAFDPATGYAFASNGDGTLTVVHEESPNKFTVIDNVPTKRGARTMGLDLKTHSIFLPTADFEPAAPGERRGKMKAGSFVVLVVSR